MYKQKLSIETVMYLYMYKTFPPFIGGETFIADIIQFDLSNFDLILVLD